MSSLKLNNLRPIVGKDKKALGRGIGSGCGKTSSYGHKGGKARSGRGAPIWFEGGQMPLYRRLPKRGFVSRFDRTGVACVNLETLGLLCDTGKLSVSIPVTIDLLKEVGAIRQNAVNVRLLGKGELKVGLEISVNYATSSAIKAVESVGGKVNIV